MTARLNEKPSIKVEQTLDTANKAIEGPIDADRINATITNVESFLERCSPDKQTTNVSQVIANTATADRQT